MSSSPIERGDKPLDLLVDLVARPAPGADSHRRWFKRVLPRSLYGRALLIIILPLVLAQVASVCLRNQIQSRKRLAAAADAFGKGREVPHFRLEGATEVRQVGMAFLKMRERIQRSITQRTEMLAGVSHDLRTPLTRMR